MASPAIKDGAVAVRAGRIEAVGTWSKMHTAYAGWEEAGCRGVVMPALINAHIHLELSHLAGVGRPGTPGQMSGWIETLLRKRAESEVGAEEQTLYRRKAAEEQSRTGVVCIADIGNDTYVPDSGNTSFPLIRYFQEFLGPTKKAAEAAAATIAELPDAVSATAHACYSTLPELIVTLKRRALRLGRVFPIHVAESAQEVKFVQDLSGPLRSFLERRGAWDGSFSQTMEGSPGVVAHLHKLGILDAGTLCVHCVHVDEDEVRLLAKAGSHVCLCPGSNRFLGVGRAPVEMMLRHGLLPAIGTDSIASNDALDLWAEMRILRDEHPEVQSRLILKMATLGGAAALDCEDDFGSLLPGRRAALMDVELKEAGSVDSEQEIYELVMEAGRPETVRRVGCGWIENECGEIRS